MVPYLLTALIISVRSQSLLDFQCNSTADCTALTEFIAAQGEANGISTTMIQPKCNTDDGFCSIDCSGFLSGLCSVLGSLVDPPLTQLTCDSTNSWCTIDLSCTQSSDCTITGMTQCAAAGVCIPTDTSSCTSNANCTTPGLGYCETRTYGGVAVQFCSYETCTTTSDCLSDGFLCADEIGVCVVPCDSVIGCAELIHGADKECDIDTGECVTRTPTETPSKAPTTIVVTDLPSLAQSTDSDESDDDVTGRKGAAKSCDVYIGMMVFMVVLLSYL